MRKPFLFIFSLVLLFGISCQERKEKPQSTASAVTIFWDKYNFKDTVNLVRPEVGEQAVVDFLTVAQQSDYKEYVAAITKMLELTVPSPTVFKFFIDTYSRYLYDPNSPMYNEELYVPVLEFVVQESSIPEYERQRFQDRLILIKRNNPGSEATNFDFDTADGKKTNLHEQKAKFNLLFFYEPGCGGCATAIEDLQRLAVVKDWIDRSELQILAIYANADPTSWKEYKQYIPTYWVNGINSDHSIIANNLYDLKASPTFYLLNDKNEVLLKDRNLAENIGYLEMNIAK